MHAHEFWRRGGIQTLDTNVDDIRRALLQRIIGPVDLWMPLLESYELSQISEQEARQFIGVRNASKK